MAFFNPEQQPWRFLARCVDFVGLSLCAVFTSLGVVTLGTSIASLYVSVVKAFRYGDNTPFKTYFTCFKKNLKEGVILALIVIPFIFLFVWGYMIMKENSSTRMGAFMFTFYYVLLLLPAGTVINLFPLLARFEMKTGEYIKTAFTLTIAHLPSTFVIVLLSIELTIWTIEYYSPCFITPSLWALLSSFFLEKNYKKHISDSEAAALENLTEEEYLEKKRKREETKSEIRRR